jgi:hypothetical protein
LRASPVPPTRASAFKLPSPPTDTSRKPENIVDEDEAMYTGPRRDEDTIEKTIQDDSATESDSSPDEPPPSKKRKVIDEEPGSFPRSPSAKGRGLSPPQRREPGSGRAGEATNSDSDSAGPSAKRGDSARPAQTGRGGATRVKQPLKRGGRRL